MQADGNSEELEGVALRDRVRGAVAWRSGTQILAQIVSWSSTLLIVRLLDPADFGLFAMTQVILVFLTFLSGYGFASSLIQSETVEPKRVRQAFGMLLLLNGTLALVQLATAPLIADYYGQPLIADLLRWQALLYVSTPFCVVPEVLMSRRLDFRRPAIVTLVTTALGAACAVAMALNGWGVWTLVFAPIVIFWTRAIGLVWATRFFVLPSFDFRGAGHMFGFGSALLVSQGLWVVQSHADIFIAGRVLDPHALGLYAEALFLTQIFTYRFVPPLNEVAFPAYARMQKDPEALATSFLTAVRLIMTLAVPLYLGLAVAAEPAVATLFGPKWIEMAPLVAVIALSMPVLTLQILFAPALNALGRPEVNARISFCGAVLMPLAFLVGVQFGAIGLACALLAGYPMLAAATYGLARRHLAIDLAGLARAIRPSLFAAVPMALAVWAIRETLPAMPAPAELAILVAAGAGLYAGLLRLAAPELVEEVIGLAVRRRAPAC